MALFSNKTYNILKHVVLVVLPGIATLYAGLGSLWSFPNITEVVGTITLLATFLGVVLDISSKQYNNKNDNTIDGELLFTEDEGETYLAFGVKNKPLSEIVVKDEVRLKVVPNAHPNEY